jgi:CHAT domain-containing protein
LAEPLDLPDGIETVLVSPDGPLCYLPWGALFPKRSVAVTPSATTHLLLLAEERARGEGVLAVGDPDYSSADAGALSVYRPGRGLVSLPGTRAEAEAVGDMVLLGKEATEEGLRAAVGRRKRWRSVHLACHGLVSAENPTLSSLALSRGGEEDGFLTALEVLRSEIPADLVVLSACETGLGKIVRGEGIVGLARAFMYAGAPRVVCSLWKVDDEATKALMVKLYELWNPEGGEGLSAAAALRRAQEFVRSHERWKHPRYWAGWVLWGLSG